MSEPRIPPRPHADWDGDVLDALSVNRPPGSPPQTPEQQAARRERLRTNPPAANILGLFAWHPALAEAYFRLNNHLFHSTLSNRTRELVTVRISWLRRGEYEWAQHMKMARKAGMSDEETAAIAVGPDDPAWGPLDAALLRATDEIAADRYVSDETWKLLSEHLDRQQLMDLVFTVGSYDLLAMATNTLGLPLDHGMTGFPA